MSDHGPYAKPAAEVLRELVRFLPDVVRLLWALIRDPRVPWHAKLLAAGAVAYAAVPVDLLPDAIPGVGQLDDAYLLLSALRRLVRAAGYDLVREHWPGSRDGLGLLLALTGLDR